MNRSTLIASIASITLAACGPISGDADPDSTHSPGPTGSPTASPTPVTPGTRFDSAMRKFAAPSADGIDTGFLRTDGYGSNWNWTTVDLDGDALPDLVWTADPARTSPRQVWGENSVDPHWRVFKGTGDGFTAMVKWSVPVAPNTDTGFYTTASGGGSDNWSLIDLDGDTRPDLVWTSDPLYTNTEVWGDNDIDPHWRVFLNNGTGFDDTFVKWPVPNATDIDPGFARPAGYGSNWDWLTVDLDGDRRPDLVWTADPLWVSTKQVWGGDADPHWRVFHNTGAGFAPMQKWPVPASPGIETGFYRGYGFGSNWSWSLLDTNGDSRPDFVWTADPSYVSTKQIWGGNDADPHWRVYVNNGAAFASGFEKWSVPASTGMDGEGFFRTGGYGSNWNWTTMDLDGDGLPDLLWTADPSLTGPNRIWGDPEIDPHWRVYTGTPTGFRPMAKWTVPTSAGMGSGFLAPTGYGSNWSWSTRDLNGDGRLDLVWTANPQATDPQQIWGGNDLDPHWRVFLNVP